MHTFLFADLVGFTALSIEQGDEQAADVATRFQREVRVLAARHGATVVKSLGDGAMVSADDAGDAVRLGLAARERPRRAAAGAGRDQHRPRRRAGRRLLRLDGEPGRATLAGGSRRRGAAHRGHPRGRAPPRDAARGARRADVPQRARSRRRLRGQRAAAAAGAPARRQAAVRLSAAWPRARRPRDGGQGTATEGRAAARRLHDALHAPSRTSCSTRRTATTATSSTSSPRSSARCA